MTHQHYTYIVQQAHICIELYLLYICSLYIQTHHEIVTHSTSILCNGGFNGKLLWCESQLLEPKERQGEGFVLNSVRSENHKTSWWTAQRHCPAPAKFCHLSTCGRQISPLRTRKRHRVLRYGDRTMAGEMMYFAYLYTRYWLRAEFTKEWRMLLYASLLVR